MVMRTSLAALTQHDRDFSVFFEKRNGLIIQHSQNSSHYCHRYHHPLTVKTLDHPTPQASNTQHSRHKVLDNPTPGSRNSEPNPLPKLRWCPTIANAVLHTPFLRSVRIVLAAVVSATPEVTYISPVLVEVRLPRC